MENKLTSMDVDDPEREIEEILLRDDQTGFTEYYDGLVVQQQNKIKELIKENLEQKAKLKKQEEEKQDFLKWQIESHQNAFGQISKPFGNDSCNYHQQPPPVPPRKRNSNQLTSQSSSFSANSFKNQRPPPIPPRTFNHNMQQQSELRTLMPHSNLFSKTQQPPPIPPRTFSVGTQGRQKSDATSGSSTNPFYQPQQLPSILTWNASLDQQRSKTFDCFNKPINQFASIDQHPFTLTSESNRNFSGQHSTKTLASNNPFSQHTEPPTWMSNTPYSVTQKNSPAFAEWSGNNVLTASSQVPQESYYGQIEAGVNNESYHEHNQHRQTIENTETTEERIFTPRPFNQNNNLLNSSASKNIMLPYHSWLQKHNMKENKTFRGKRGGNPQKRKFFAEKFSKKNNVTNKTLENVASYHLSLAKGAMEEKNFKKKPNFKRALNQ